MWIWLAIAAACEPQPAQELVDALDRAEAGFAAADLQAFRDALGEVDEVTGCLSEVVSEPLAARLHRVQGLAAFFAEDAEQAARAFGSARRLQPDYRFDPSLVPPGNPLLEVYFASDPFGPASDVPSPAEGFLHFDGQPGTTRPMAGPTLFQLEQGDTVRTSVYLWPDTPLPTYEAMAEPPPPPTPAKRSLRVPLAIGAGAATLVAGGLYGANLGVHGRYDDATTTAELDRLRGLNNGLVVGSGVALSAAVGLGIGAVVSR